MHGQHIGSTGRVLVKQVFCYGYTQEIRRQYSKVKKEQHNTWRYKASITIQKCYKQEQKAKAGYFKI